MVNSYIFLGPELGKKQDAVNAVKKKFSGADESVFYCGETPLSEICNTLQNRSLFTEKQIVIVKNAETIKKKDEIELLVSCIKKPEQNTALILLSDEIKLAAGLEDAVPKNNKQVFYEMFESEKAEWLRNFFKNEGVDINEDCISVILELVENNTAALKRECSRLINFLPRTSGQEALRLKPEEIEKWLSHNREESAFTLFSRIAAGDLSKALESAAVMLAAKQSVQSILSGLVWCFRKLIDYLVLLETSGNYGEINNFELKKIGLSSPKAKDDYAAATRRYSIEGAEACLALTAEYNILFRSPAAVFENLLMDRYIIALFKHVL
jgi:DNA polymerase-3 subunit delta